MSNKLKITQEDVVKIGKLCNLNLSKVEITNYSQIFTDILGYINVMDELDLTKVKPTYQVTGLKNVFRDESICTTLSQEEALSNAPLSEKGLFATSAVFDRD